MCVLNDAIRKPRADSKRHAIGTCGKALKDYVFVKWVKVSVGVVTVQRIKSDAQHVTDTVHPFYHSALLMFSLP